MLGSDAIVIATILFLLLSAVVLILMLSTMRKMPNPDTEYEAVGLNTSVSDTATVNLNNMNVQTIANYIEGEDETFKKLAKMIKQAKYSLRTSSFSPQGISGTDNETKKEFFEALCDFGKKTDVTCKRIMCMNEKSKENDLLNTMSWTRGGSMELYLTKRNNNFELAVIDDIAAFICFYDDMRRIKTTLFITNKLIIHEIEKVYDRMLSDSAYEFQVIRCADYSTPTEIAKQFSSTIMTISPSVDLEHNDKTSDGNTSTEISS